MNTPGHGKAPQAQSKARASRKSVSLNGYVLTDQGTVCQASLINLSYEGCCVRTDEPLHVGERVKLSVLSRGGLGCRVQWYKNGEAGLRFDDAPVDEKAISKRRSERALVEAQVHVRNPGSAGYRVRVYDASPQGCRVEDLDCFLVGEPVWVRFPGLEGIEAQLKWRDAACAGLEFAHPIHPAVFDLLLTRLKYSSC